MITAFHVISCGESDTPDVDKYFDDRKSATQYAKAVSKDTADIIYIWRCKGGFINRKFYTEESFFVARYKNGKTLK